MTFVHSPFSFLFLDPFFDFNKLDVGFKEAGCRMSYVGLLQVGCRSFTSRISGFNKSDVGFLQVGCRIFTSRMSNVEFLKSDVG